MAIEPEPCPLCGRPILKAFTVQGGTWLFEAEPRPDGGFILVEGGPWHSRLLHSYPADCGWNDKGTYHAVHGSVGSPVNTSCYGAKTSEEYYRDKIAERARVKAGAP